MPDFNPRGYARVFGDVFSLVCHGFYPCVVAAQTAPPGVCCDGVLVAHGAPVPYHHVAAVGKPAACGGFESDKCFSQVFHD